MCVRNGGAGCRLGQCGADPRARRMVDVSAPLHSPWRGTSMPRSGRHDDRGWPCASRRTWCPPVLHPVHGSDEVRHASPDPCHVDQGGPCRHLDMRRGAARRHLLAQTDPVCNHGRTTASAGVACPGVRVRPRQVRPYPGWGRLVVPWVPEWHRVIDRRSMPMRAEAVPHDVAPYGGHHGCASHAPFRSE
jgi:hypothetical protein